MKLNVKKALIALVAIVAVVVIGFTISPMSKQEGEKSITITILNDESKETLLDNKVLKTDAESLGEVLVQYKDELQLEAEESEYGLYITGFLGLSAKENGATGPWWMYSYESPSQGLEMPIGQAPGVDSLMIHDGDMVTFSYTSNMGW
ncbi:DUF4430 domain-containing protein [Turicibacter bilis]|uniref:DUF4430 domain-containing protein n=1 Tax=Turicibacter bilis TaxID=2735723 RepID=A0ABY5JJM4_9FIRM|nr:DUF4430 domain-containing protein [Turicibacter bilis]MBS3201326.1 DUF4430 domain-containing protein [Turicibacter bilis]UUF06902.1 DUF4430 domain-containing protein [Turicibacter bilis]